MDAMEWSIYYYGPSCWQRVFETHLGQIIYPKQFILLGQEHSLVLNEKSAITFPG